MNPKKIIVIGSGNAALCASMAALENGATVIILEKTNKNLSGGNSKYTAGAMRFVYNNNEELYPLLTNPTDEKIAKTEFGTYTKQKFEQDLLGFNNGKPLSMQQHILINNSYKTMRWLASHHVKFEPIFSRQTFEKNGKYIFWGGLTLEAKGEGVGLVEAELQEVEKLGGTILYEQEALELIVENERVVGVKCSTPEGEKIYEADAIVLGCGGFQSNANLRKKYMGENWGACKVRGTPANTGAGIEMALKVGAVFHGNPEGCHAVPMDLKMQNYGNLEIPHLQRKNYRKICYFLGIMLNANGVRFVDEGKNFRNYTYAQFGKAILEQPNHFAWQIFDSKVEPLLYEEYRFWDAHFVQADNLENLVKQLEGVNQQAALQTISQYNNAVDTNTKFDPTILDGKATQGLSLNKTNWANTLDTPPFKAYPVTCGITFTYSGLKVNKQAAVLNKNDEPINGLFACGELVGGVFYNGYPGGSGLTSGAVFGKLAGEAAARG